MEKKQLSLIQTTPTYDDNVVNDEVLVVCGYKISLNFCKDCRIFHEGEREMKVDAEVKVDGLNKERPSIKIPSVDERPRVRQRPRVDSKLTRPNCTQIVQYCGLEQPVEGVASCDVGGILPSSWSKYHFGMKSIRRSLQPLWSRLVG